MKLINCNDVVVGNYILEMNYNKKNPIIGKVTRVSNTITLFGKQPIFITMDVDRKYSLVMCEEFKYFLLTDLEVIEHILLETI